MREKICFKSAMAILMALSIGTSCSADQLDLSQFRQDLGAPDKLTSDYVSSYINAESSQVRYNSYAAIWEVAKKKPYDEKNQLLQHLAQGMSDKEKSVREASVKWLLQFREKDVSSETSALIAKNLEKRELDKNRILLAGLYGTESTLNTIRKLGSTIVQDPEVGRWYGTKEWASNLVLARLGEIDSEELVQRVESESNVVARVTICLQDITYIKQPEGVQLLLKYLNSEDRFPSVRDSTLGEKVCLRAAYFLAQSIEGFPIVKEYYSDYTEEDIATCRKWMSSQSDWSFR